MVITLGARTRQMAWVKPKGSFSISIYQTVCKGNGKGESSTYTTTEVSAEEAEKMIRLR